MDTKLVREICRTLDAKSTDELIQIYRHHNEEEWSSEAFEAIQQILIARSEAIPTIDHTATIDHIASTDEEMSPVNIKKTVHRKSSSFVVLTVMTFLSLIVACFTTVMTFIIPAAFMMFDAPRSQRPAILILFISFITAPLVCLFSLVFAWRFYTTERYAVACYVSLIPWVNILLFVLTELFRMNFWP